MNVWEKIHQEREWGKYPNEEFVRFIGRYFFNLGKDERKKIKICELGVGQGANVWFLLKEHFDVYGIDISSTALKKLKRRLEIDYNITCLDNFENRFKVGDIRNIPFSDAMFDVVADVATTWYVSYNDHKKVYREINRILKPGGLFFTFHILKGSWGYDENNLIDKDTVLSVKEGPLANQGVIYFADYKDLINLLVSAGFSIIEKEILIRSYENMTKFLKFAVVIAKKIGGI